MKVRPGRPSTARLVVAGASAFVLALLLQLLFFQDDSIWLNLLFALIFAVVLTAIAVLFPRRPS